ncbi:MAG: hypothetical protein U1F39_06770 [Steroidobacteraceae bacterium]
MNTQPIRAARITVLPPQFRYEAARLTYEGMLDAGWLEDQALVAAISMDDILCEYRASPAIPREVVIKALCKVIRDNTRMCQLRRGMTHEGVDENESI